jgi:hypothetical protein
MTLHSRVTKKTQMDRQTDKNTQHNLIFSQVKDKIAKNSVNLIRLKAAKKKPQTRSNFTQHICK